ncbi:LysR family transcriptional regulator [Rhodovastum atsumiense]|uniref:LysR family transcriptional regulator n=1 Tax=Rhodovastum atsumiense TaxID=504468 RepID=UPI001EEFEEBA|nr:LysR family transcriptional regulator [Rhodovastum atsumiense]CAH2602285.1 LysR family transcriptional regulator [Rhodovastum atsumiense]
MTLRQLEILRAVMRFETTMAAARHLGMSQPAVSNAIRQMELQSGLALFERVNNRLFPTEAARLVQEESDPLFAMYAALDKRLKDLREDKVSRLHILSTPPLGHGVLPLALQRFTRHHPRLRSFFHVRELDDVIKAVEAGTTDLGFGLGMSPHPALQMEPLFEGRMVCVCPHDHPLARVEVVTPADLAGHGFVALEAGTRMGAAVRRAFADLHQPFTFTVEVRYCETACVLAAAGLGASVVDPFSPSGLAGGGLMVKPFEPVIPSVAYVFWSARRQISPTARRFLQEIRDVLAQTTAVLRGQH